MRPHTAVNPPAEGAGHHRGLLGRRRQRQGALDDHGPRHDPRSPSTYLMPGGDDEARDRVDGLPGPARRRPAAEGGGRLNQ
jgi:hypothetical protein